MKRTIARFSEYQPLLKIVNEHLTEENWRATLQEFEAWQLEWHLELEPSGDSDRVPNINGAEASLEAVRDLRNSLRGQLTELAELCRDYPKLLRESKQFPFARGGSKAWTWRKALVLPTRQIFFEDAGEGLNFVAETLEHEIKGYEKEGAKSGRRGWRPLHLSLCECGCKEFFLWEGNWKRKRRGFLDDKHRMRFHNRHNIRRKRLLARQRRGEGHPNYF